MNCRWLPIFLVWATTATSLLACRYSVRDVAFVDLEPVPYFLYCFINDDADRPTADQAQQIASGVFLDSNVTLQVVDLNATPEHPARARLGDTKPGELPVAVLVNPDQRTLKLNLPAGKDGSAPSKDQIWNFVEGTVLSPFRERLLESVVEAYAVVLMVEGTDAEQNQRARKAIEQAISAIESVMPRMPKPVDVPPKLIVLSSQEAARENILLWSLDLKSEAAPEPQAAIVLGRGRRIGPTLTGGMVTQTQVQEILGLIGQDCECELDRVWMQGPMIPARWDTELQQLAFKELDFDAENPLVKSEMSRILARGPNSRGTPAPAPTSFDSLFLGYSEEVISDSPTPESEATTPDASVALAAATEPAAVVVAPSDSKAANLPVAADDEADDEADADGGVEAEDDGATPIRPVLLALIVIGAGTLIGGGIVILMAMKRG